MHLADNFQVGKPDNESTAPTGDRNLFARNPPRTHAWQARKQSGQGVVAAPVRPGYVGVDGLCI